MRHGRKSRRVRVDGYKRHVLHDLESGLVRAVGVTAANAAEASVTTDLDADLAAQHVGLTDLDELHLDRAYLSSRWVRERPATLTIRCKAWPVRNGDRFPKTAFTLDWQRQQLECPNHITLPFQLGGTVHFPAAVCAVCPLQIRCTTSTHGRSVHIHPDERLLAELRERQQTREGRAQLRERVAVEHTLAHVSYWQGKRARYCGQRKNLFDLRRCVAAPWCTTSTSWRTTFPPCRQRDYLTGALAHVDIAEVGAGRIRVSPQGDLIVERDFVVSIRGDDRRAPGQATVVRVRDGDQLLIGAERG
jgi:transposase